MISLIYKQRALPLAFRIVKGKKDHLPEDMHVQLIHKLRPLILESTQKVVLLGDGEFDGTNLQQTLSEFGWKYACRTSYNITIYVDDEPYQIEMLAGMLPKGHCNGLQNCQITRKKYGPVTVVAWWGEDQKEPLFLVTNFSSIPKACDYYSKRFTIETFFSDQKSRGFDIDRSHLSCPQRLTRLMYASCLAYLWIIFFWYLGMEDRFAQASSSC
jgi:hypothetical protein